jgi:hypothetical protein
LDRLLASFQRTAAFDFWNQGRGVLLNRHLGEQGMVGDIIRTLIFIP